MRSSSGGTFLLICEMLRTWAACTFLTVWKSVSPRKSRCPARSSHRMIPTAKMSVRASTSCPIAASGDRYENFPLMIPGSLRSSCELAFASPKSTILISPYFVTSTFGGDMSRWTIFRSTPLGSPSSCGWLRPLQMSRAVGTAEPVRAPQPLADLEGDEGRRLHRELAPVLPERLGDRLQIGSVDVLH